MAILASAGRAPVARHASTTIARTGESSRDVAQEPRRGVAVSRRAALLGSSAAIVGKGRTKPAVADDFVKDPSFFAEWSYCSPRT